MSQSLTVLMCSAGRRNYLARWFREALRVHHPESRLIVADADRFAPVQADADAFALLPSISDPGYAPALLELCESEGVSIALSLNDYELSLWSRSSALDRSMTRFLRLSSDAQTLLEDKRKLADVLPSHGVRVPLTVTAEEYLAGAHRSWRTPRVVLKNRYGSGSAGLLMTSADHVSRDLGQVLPLATNRNGERLNSYEEQAEAVIVQEFVEGDEYGIDVVSDFDGRYGGTLARRKLSMRGGETDRATTVESRPFEEIARQLTGVLRPSGSIDADVIVDEGGIPWVIDINPRLGGGYPFSHVAGANVPGAYVGWASGESGQDVALAYRVGVTAAKYIDIAPVDIDSVAEAAAGNA